MATENTKILRPTLQQGRGLSGGTGQYATMGMRTPQKSEIFGDPVKPAPTTPEDDYTARANATTDAALQKQTTFWDAYKAAQQRWQEEKRKSDAEWERKQRNARKWASWIDALSAVGNMIWTTRNSGNLRDQNNTAAKATDARLQERTAWRDKNEAALNAYRNAADNADMQRLRAKLNADNQRLQNEATGAKLRNQQAANEIKRAYNAAMLKQRKDNADREYELKKQGQESLNAYRNSQLANSAERNRIYASKGNGSGGSGGKVVGTVEGQSYYNNNDYSTALYGAARKYGIPTQTQTKNWDGSTKTVNRNWKNVAADVEAAYKRRRNNAGNGKKNAGLPPKTSNRGGGKKKINWKN